MNEQCNYTLGSINITALCYFSLLEWCLAETFAQKGNFIQVRQGREIGSAGCG